MLEEAVRMIVRRGLKSVCGDHETSLRGRGSAFIGREND